MLFCNPNVKMEITWNKKRLKCSNHLSRLLTQIRRLDRLYEKCMQKLYIH